MRNSTWYRREGIRRGIIWPSQMRQALGLEPLSAVVVSPYAEEFLAKAQEKRERKAKRNLALLKLSLPKVSL